MTTVGIIGSGRIGGTEARLAIAAGYDVVVLSNSRGPQALKDLVEELGPQARAATPAGAAPAGDLVVVSIPPRAYPAVPVEPLAGWPVLDTINHIPQRDQRIPGLAGSLSSSEVLQRHLGTVHVVEVAPSGTSPRWPVRRAVTDFLEAIGYDTVDAVSSAPAAAVSSSVPAHSSCRTARSATSGVPCQHSGNTRRTRRLIATGDQRSGDCADMAAGQLPVVVSMARYSLNTCSDRERSTRNTVVSGPTKTSAQTSAVAGVRAVLATALAADRHGRSG